MSCEQKQTENLKKNNKLFYVKLYKKFYVKQDILCKIMNVLRTTIWVFWRSPFEKLTACLTRKNVPAVRIYQEQNLFTTYEDTH